MGYFRCWDTEFDRDNGVPEAVVEVWGILLIFLAVPACMEPVPEGVGPDGKDPESGCAGRCRQAGEYIGYTSDHLPDRKFPPPWPSAAAAILAIRAARMAFSSLRMRSLLK